MFKTKVSSTKIGALITAIILIVYIGLLSNTAISLLGSKSPIGIAMGALLLLFPLLGVWAVIIEVRFGLATERLCRLVEQEGAWPDLGIELRPSGRPVRASADAAFQKFKSAADSKPGDWRSWFNLSLAYDACGDRRRARAAMRDAIKLSK